MSATMKTKSDCNFNEEEFDLRRGPWTLEEDNLLIHYITCHGEGRWNLLAKCAGLKRTGKSCRLRWLNYLKPDIKRGNLTPQEQLQILQLHSKWGNRWSKIAQHLPGRTDNEIKNYWRTRVQKQARQLKIDSNSKRFLEAVRCFWMPRLLEKMEQSSSSSESSSISTIEIQNSTITSLLANQAPVALSSPQPSKVLEDYSFNHVSDSMTISQLPEIPEHPISAVHAFANTAHINSLPVPNDCYHVDLSSFDMEIFNQPAMSAVGSHDIAFSDCQMAESDLIDDDVAGNLWNMDELWQFRQPEEVGI